MPTPNNEQMFRFMQAYVAVEPVSNRTHLERRREIISPMPTGQNRAEFSRETRRHAIIVCMASQGGVLVR